MKIYILIFCTFILLSGCTSNKQELQKDKNTPNKTSVGITTNDLKTEMSNLKTIDAQTVNKKDYPQVIGTYSENGQTLIKKYFCSDLCPDYARINIVYKDITSKEGCAKVDGKDLIDPAWGGYIGCTPKINK